LQQAHFDYLKTFDFERNVRKKFKKSCRMLITSCYLRIFGIYLSLYYSLHGRQHRKKKKIILNWFRHHLRFGQYLIILKKILKTPGRNKRFWLIKIQANQILHIFYQLKSISKTFTIYSAFTISLYHFLVRMRSHNVEITR
jgi:hypothetical protein